MVFLSVKKLIIVGVGIGDIVILETLLPFGCLASRTSHLAFRPSVWSLMAF